MKRRPILGYYWTVKDIEGMTTRSIIDVRQENKWIVIELDNGMRFKMRNW